MPYLVAVAGLSSTLSLTILTLSPSEPAISSSAGAIMRQGPHHSAQKSTTTGPVAFNTSDSNVVSDTLLTAMGTSLLSRGRVPHRKAERRNAPGGRQGSLTCRTDRRFHDPSGPPKLPLNQGHRSRPGRPGQRGRETAP